LTENKEDSTINSVNLYYNFYSDMTDINPSFLK